MGIEYTIRFQCPPRSELDRAIRGLPYFRDFDEEFELYNLWNDPVSARTGMPDTHAAIKDDGIYFCENAANSSGIDDSLLEIAKRFDPNATIEEL